MSVRRRLRRRSVASRRRSVSDHLLTYPVGVLIRDKDNKVYYLTLAQLDEFRREDLESPSVIAQFEAGQGILGLKNAWLVEGIGIRSGD